MNRRERLEFLRDKMKKFNNVYVYVKNFSEEIDDEKLRDMFEPFGKIISAKVMDNEFAFVSYEEPEAAKRAVEALNGNDMGLKLMYGDAKLERQAELKEMFDRIRMERINRYQGVNLYVKNLDDNIDDERLRKEFSQFGTITSAKVMSEGGRSKGFGFVCFSSPEEATKAVIEMNGRIVVAKPMYVALAQRKEDRKAHLAPQYVQRIASMQMQHKKYTMASLSMAQEVLICDGCNISPVQKYCNKCDTSLCDGCIVKHISSDKTKSHDIVTYELKKEEPIYPDCARHTKQQCEMFCKECDTPICVKCITSGSHGNHQIMDLLEFFSSDKDAISQDTETLETIIYPTIKNAISELQTKVAELPKNHEKLIASISQQGAEWHHEIDIIIEKRKEQAKDMNTRDLCTLQKLLADMKNLLSAISQAILDNKELMTSKKFSEMRKYKSKIPEFTKLPSKFDVTPPTFTPAPIPKEQLEKMFGILKSSSLSPHGHIETTSAVSIPRKQKPIDSPKVRSDFETGYGGLYDIACHSPDDIWVTGGNKNMKRFNHKGALQQTITTTTGEWPGDITVTLQGELIYTDQGDDNIYIVRNGKPQKMITVQGWIPRKLCYTAAGDLLVGMRKDDQTPKKVVRYRRSTEKQILQFDQDGKPWFSTGSCTLFIDENRNGDLCASDYKAKQIVVINRAEKLRFRYTGNLSANKYTSFYPHGIATDSESQILVADRDNNCIHIISEDGHFIRYIDNCQLSRLFDLSLDKNNTLYVTELDTGKVKMIEYMK